MGDWCGSNKAATRKQLKKRVQEKGKTKTCLE